MTQSRLNSQQVTRTAAVAALIAAITGSPPTVPDSPEPSDTGGAALSVVLFASLFLFGMALLNGYQVQPDGRWLLVLLVLSGTASWLYRRAGHEEVARRRP